MTDTTTPTSTAPLFRLVTADSTNEALKDFPEIINYKVIGLTTYEILVSLTATRRSTLQYVQQIINLDDDDEYEVLMSKDNKRVVYLDYDEVSGNWIEKNTGFESVNVDVTPIPNIVDINGITYLVVSGGFLARNNGVGSYIDTYTKNSEGNWTKLSDEDNPFNHIFYPDYPIKLRFFDMNGDGDLELVAGYIGVIDIYDQDSSGEWIKQDYGYSTTFIKKVQEMAPGDFDNDGDVDMVTSVFDHSIRYLQNDDNIWTDLGNLNGTLLDSNYNQLPYSFDIDNDGDLDLLVANRNEPYQIYENLLYSPDDPVKVIRHASQQINITNSQKNNINLDDYFTDKTEGDLTFTIDEDSAFVQADNIVTFSSTADLGVHTLQVTATNSAGFTRKQAINVNVSNVDVVPGVVSVPSGSAPNRAPLTGFYADLSKYDTQETWTLELNDLFIDPEGDILTFTVDGLPAFTEYTVGDNEITFTTNNTATGTYTVNISADDDNNDPVPTEYVFEVEAQNDEPTVNDSAKTSFKLYEAENPSQNQEGIYLPSLFNDEERDPLSYTYRFIESKPEGFAFNPVYGNFYLAGTTKEFDGDIRIEVTAYETSNPTTHSAVTTLTFTINEDGIINDTPTTKFAEPNLAHEQVTATVTEDAPFSYNVITPLGFNDEESGTALTYSISGDESEHFSINAKTGDITAEHTEHTLLGTDGAAIITVKASDGNSSVSASLSLNILYQNDAPTAKAQADIQAESGKQGETLDVDVLNALGLADEEDDATDMPLTLMVHYINKSGSVITLGDGTDDTNPFYLDDGHIKSKELPHEKVGTYMFTITASDSGKDNAGTAKGINSVTRNLEVVVANINDAPKTTETEVSNPEIYLNGTSAIIDLNTYFTDVDIEHGDALKFIITADDQASADFLTSAVAQPTEENGWEFELSSDEAVLNFSPDENLTGTFGFDVKARDLGLFGDGAPAPLDSPEINFSVEMKNEYRWDINSETPLQIRTRSRDADNRAAIVVTGDEADKFIRWDWDWDANNLELGIVFKDANGKETIKPVANIANPFTTYAPQEIYIQQGDEQNHKLYLNVEYKDGDVLQSSISPEGDSDYQLILPYQGTSATGSQAIAFTANVASGDYYIYSREHSLSEDKLVGYRGDDTFYILGKGSNDINGAGGSDTAIYVNPEGALDIDLRPQRGLVTVNKTESYTDKLRKIENIIIQESDVNDDGVVDSFDNALLGTSGANLLQSAGGDDYIEGRGGADTLLGGGGDDIIAVTGTEASVDGGSHDGFGDRLRLTGDEQVDYLSSSGGTFQNFEILDISLYDKNFVVTLDKDAIENIFGGTVSVEAFNDGGVKDVVILKYFMNWEPIIERESTIGYRHKDGATITFEDESDTIIKAHDNTQTHSVDISLTDGDFLFRDRADNDNHVIIHGFDASRFDVLILDDGNKENTDISYDDFKDNIVKWELTADKGLKFYTGTADASKQVISTDSSLEIRFDSGIETDGIEASHNDAGTFNEEAWATVVDALGSADAFSFA